MTVAFQIIVPTLDGDDATVAVTGVFIGGYYAQTYEEPECFPDFHLRTWKVLDGGGAVDPVTVAKSSARFAIENYWELGL